MANVTRSGRKVKDNEDNISKESQSSVKTSSGATTAEVSGVRKSPRDMLSKKNVTLSSSPGTRKSERLEKQTLNSNSITPPPTRKSERIEKQKNPSPLRRSDRGKMPSSFSSPGSKKLDGSHDSNVTKGKKEKKEKSVKQLTMETEETNKINKEDGQDDRAQKKRMDARAYKSLYRNQRTKVNATDHIDAVDKSDSELTEDDPLVSKIALVAREINNDADKVELENLQTSELLNNVLHGAIPDCDTHLEMAQTIMSSQENRHDIDTVCAASPIMSSIDNCSAANGGEALLTSGCKRKNCIENCGTCSKRQRVDCNLTEETCSFNTKSSQLFGSSNIKDEEKLDAGVGDGHVEKSANDIQKHMSYADHQTANYQNACIVCKLGGELLRCYGRGCQRNYHNSCLVTPLKEVRPLAAWHCLLCVRKKLESGVHSVSDGIEAIWDSRELEVSEDGLQRQKQYFVKYKGLAHVHNRWVTEDYMLREAPLLLAEYNRKNKDAIWKQRWAVPRRVLQKRLLMFPKDCNEHHHKGHDNDKIVEWLVKWCGLGYEHASWEAENASFFNCPGGQSLIQDYETRRSNVKRVSKFDKEHAQERRDIASLKESKLQAGISSWLDVNLDAVNKLCKFLHKGENAIIFDDQERILNVISFILSFLSHTSRPFLIITSSSSQYSWDEEFLRLAPSADVVVYSGSKEIRRSIRTLEFYEERCIMFQILITSPEFLAEDLNELDSIEWEAIIVDECEHPRIASCFEQIKMLISYKRLLIVSSQLKENAAEYLNLLSLLDSQKDSNVSDSLDLNSSDNISILKERLCKYTAYKSKVESSRFVEYWVPVKLSDVQVEKYCFTLLSNRLSLCSPSKTDPVGAVYNTLISSRKCCDHPYIVDQSLQTLLTKGLNAVENLDVGIKTSAKLQLLDQMLLEIKKREYKVLILFQSIGGRDLMGDILDDYLRQRFGADSYERVGGGLIPSRKQSALNNFNNEKERFVFLIETRACLPSIKLSAVGTVIIFGSDWSPVNDLRSLHRITLDSQFEQIKVFRLYSSFTVEERVLMLSKQDKTLDSSLQNISPSNCHMLLMWGASVLFQQLGKFHDVSTSDTSNSSEQSHLKDVIQEFLIILDQVGVDYDASKLSLILQFKQNRGMYKTEMPLFGEQQIKETNEDPPNLFWTKLLTGKSPRWKHSFCSSQRNRKRIQHFDDPPKKPEAENAEVVKRRKKVVNDGNGYPSPKAGLHEGNMAAGNGHGSSPCGFPHSLGRSIASDSDKILPTSKSPHMPSISKIPPISMAEWESRRKQRDSQKNLHVLLKPQIAKLCEVLHLSEDVKMMVEMFLEYVMNNHLVNREPETILQAFKISLCWNAASLLKHKIDRKVSLALARQHLGFSCKIEEAEYVHSMLRCLKRMFLHRTGRLKVPESPKASEVGSDLDAISYSGQAPDFQLALSDLEKSIKEVKKKMDKKIAKLVKKQSEETEQLSQKYEEEKAQLENKIKTEAAVIRLHSNVSMTADKLKKLEDDYRIKFDELKYRMDVELESLEASWAVAITNVRERKTRWVESIKSWARIEFMKPPVSEVNLSDGRSSMGVNQFVSITEEKLSKIVHSFPDKVIAFTNPIDGFQPDVLKIVGSTVVSDNALSLKCSSEDQLSNTSTLNMSKKDPKTCPITGPEKIVSVEAPNSEEGPGESTFSKTNGEVAIGATETFSEDSLREVDGEAPLKKFATDISCIGQENVVLLEDYSFVEVTDRSDLSKVGQASLIEPVIANSDEGADNVISAAGPLPKDIPDRATLSLAAEEVPLNTCDAVSSSEAQENVISANASLEKQMNCEATFNVHDNEVPTSTSEIATPIHGMDILVSSSRGQIPDVAAVSVPAEEVSLAVCENSPSEDLEGGNVQRENDVTNATEIDHDGVVCNKNQECGFHELSLVDVSPMQHSATFDHFGQLSPDQIAGQVTETPCVATNVRCNEPNANSLIVELREQIQLLGSTESNCNLSPPNLPSDGLNEHQPSNGQTVNQVPQAAQQEVPNHIELSRQDILQPLLSPVDGTIGGLVRHPSEARTASVPSFNGRPVPALSSWVPQRLHPDPLQHEMERIRNETVQAINIHETVKQQLIEECEKEIEEVRKKYDIKRKEKETEFELKRKELDLNYNKVLLNKILAEAFRSKCMDNKPSGAAGAQQEASSSFMEQLVQLSSQQHSSTVPASSQQPVTVPGRRPSGSPSMVHTQTMGPPPPVQAVPYIPIRPPHCTYIPSTTGNLAGNEIRTPAPHLQPFRPTSISPTPPTHSQSHVVPTSSQSRVLPSQQVQSNHHVASPSPLQPYVNSLPHRQAQASTSCQSGRMTLPETAGVLAPVPNSSDVLVGRSGANTNPPNNLLGGVSSSLTLPTSVHQESNMPSVRPNPGQQSELTDIVCLSDDD